MDNDLKQEIKNHIDYLTQDVENPKSKLFLNIALMSLLKKEFEGAMTREEISEVIKEWREEG